MPGDLKTILDILYPYIYSIELLQKLPFRNYLSTTSAGGSSN